MGSISVRLLRMLAGVGQLTHVEWGTRFTFLGVRETLAMRGSQPQIPTTAEIAEVTGQDARVVRRGMRQLRMLNFLEAGVVDDPVSARPNSPDKYYAVYDMSALVDIHRKTRSYQIPIVFVHLLTFPSIRNPEGLKLTPQTRRSLIEQLPDPAWKKLREAITTLRNIRVLSETGQRDQPRLRVRTLEGKSTKTPADTRKGKKPDPEPAAVEEPVVVVEEKKPESSESEASVFESVDLSELRDQILVLRQSGGVKEMEASNQLSVLYNRRLDDLTSVLETLAATSPEKGALLRSRFQRYSEEELRVLDGYRDISDFRLEAGREPTESEVAFYGIRRRHLSAARPHYLPIIPIAAPTEAGSANAPAGGKDVLIPLTSQQERLWNRVIKELWAECASRYWDKPPEYVHRTMHAAVDNLRGLMQKTMGVPLHDPEKEVECREAIEAVMEKAAAEAVENPRVKQYGFTPGWVLSYWKARMKEK